MTRIDLIPQVTPDGRIILKAVVPTSRERLRRVLRRLRRARRS